MRLNGKSLLIGVAISFCTSWLWAQENDETLKLGFSYGIGSQANFPFNDPDYSFDSEYYKVQLTYRLTGKGRWSLELNVEPSLYISEYHVLIPYSGQVYRRLGYPDPSTYPGDTKMEEYALNFGLISRFRVIEAISVYVLGSIGPRISNQGTPRLSQGLAFSDIAALGMSYQLKRFLFDLRVSLRHVSNAGLYAPNVGHNSTSIETGFAYTLSRKAHRE